ncbi:MAG: hypothetical protein QOG78_4159 [Rhodospirillaceae bacterium]|jgi:hypothetical protein|nr:hypothetical protein [Rhodospirillaceae bacterium]MEA2848878.1 hypothetical protein [Rhodospirillaceae bacterium]
MFTGSAAVETSETSATSQTSQTSQTSNSRPTMRQRPVWKLCLRRRVLPA